MSYLSTFALLENVLLVALLILLPVWSFTRPITSLFRLWVRYCIYGYLFTLLLLIWIVPLRSGAEGLGVLLLFASWAVARRRWANLASRSSVGRPRRPVWEKLKEH